MWPAASLRTLDGTGQSPIRVALLLCIAGIVAGIFLGYYINQQQREDREQVFEELTIRASEQFRLRMQAYEYGLHGARSAVLAIGADNITRRQFSEYITTQSINQKYPGLLGYGLIRRVSPNNEKAFLEAARLDGWPNFQIRQLTAHANDRWIIQYLEPVILNQAAIGLDLASELSRRDTIQKAIETGEPTITPPITLLQAGNRANQGFLIMLPIYATQSRPATSELRQRYAKAMTYSTLLIGEVLQKFDFRNDEFSMTIRVPDITGKLVTVFTSAQADSPATMGLIRRHKIDVYGQQWLFEFKARPNFILGLHQAKPGLVVLQVVLLSFLLAALLFAYLEFQRRKLNDWMEKERFGGVIRYANDAIIGLDVSGKITSWNQSAQTIFGYDESQAIGQSAATLTVPDAQADEQRVLLHRVLQGESIPHFTTQRCCRGGHLMHVGMTAFPLKDNQQRVVGAAMIIRDVSLQVAAQERVRQLNADLENKVLLRTAELELARRDLQTIFDAMPAMIGYWDKNQKNRVANKAYQNWFDCSPTQIKDMHIRELLGDEGYEQNLPYIEGALRGEAQVFERAWPAQDDKVRRHTLANYLPDVVNGEVLGFYVIVNDVTEITEYRLQLEALLRHNEILLSTISQQMLYSVTDRQGRILEVNDNFCRVSGFSREELIGQNHRMINSAYHSHTFWQEMWRTISSGKAWHEEVCNRSKSGSLYWVDSVIAPFTGSSGEIERFVSLRTDITQRKIAEAELARVADLLSNVLAAASEMSIIATDKTGVITLFNAGAEALLGGSAEDFIGAHMVSTIHCPLEVSERAEELTAQYGEPISGFRALVHCPERMGAEVREWDYIRQNGSRVRVSLVMTVMRDFAGHVTGYLAIAQDISERIAKDHALQEAKQFAEQANEAKSIFLANMSHEIRTPMNGIMGLCYMLEKQSLPAASHKLVHKIQAASQSLLGIINDVLDFSKIEANRLEVEQIPFRLSELIDNLTSITRGTLHDKNVQLIIASLPKSLDWVLGDPLRVGQVLTNLLSNAVKFTRQGSIKLSVNILERSDSDVVRVQFSIQDTGVGIPEEKLQLIFDAFSQADTSTSRSYGGTGLGLTICRRLTELMGGTIAVGSVVGQGSIFKVELPFQLPHETSNSLSSSEFGIGEVTRVDGKRLQGIRILIADDSELNREVAEFVLSGEGAVVETVNDGRAAVNRVQTSPIPFDVVLMDIQMPILDGHDATREIRAMPDQQNLPIIALTAGAMVAQRKAALAAGMNGFVAKPFDVDQLVAAVRLHARQPSLSNESKAYEIDAELNAAIQAFKQRFLTNRLPNHLVQLNLFVAGDSSANKTSVRAALHSMAGEAGMVELHEIGDLARRLETHLDGQEISEEELRLQVHALIQKIQAAINDSV